jgi:hypothetical protein
MLESGNPQIFTEGVSSFFLIDFLIIREWFVNGFCNFQDSYGDKNRQANTGRYRSPPQGYSQARAEYQGAARHVHGHGHARRVSGKQNTRLFSSISIVVVVLLFQFRSIDLPRIDV